MWARIAEARERIRLKERSTLKKPYEQKRFTLSRLNKNKNKDPVAEKAARELEEELVRGMKNGQLVKLVLLSPQHVSTSALIFATYRFINCELNGTN